MDVGRLLCKADMPETWVQDQSPLWAHSLSLNVTHCCDAWPQPHFNIATLTHLDTEMYNVGYFGRHKYIACGHFIFLTICDLSFTLTLTLLQWHNI